MITNTTTITHHYHHETLSTPLRTSTINHTPSNTHHQTHTTIHNTTPSTTHQHQPHTNTNHTPPCNTPVRKTTTGNFTWVRTCNCFSRHSNITQLSAISGAAMSLASCQQSCISSFHHLCVAVEYSIVTSECWAHVGEDWQAVLTHRFQWPHVEQFLLCESRVLYFFRF